MVWMKWVIKIFFVLIAITIIVLFFPKKVTHIEYVCDKCVTANIGENIFFLKKSETQTEKTKGLSGVIKMGENYGMLFIYNNPDKYGIWMKDMNFPIDIIWLDAEKKVIDIKENALPESFPNVFYPQSPATYIIELNAGTAEKEKINIGDIVVFYL